MSFAHVALPLPIRQTFVYRVPESLADRVMPGVPVQVPFRGRPRLETFVLGGGGYLRQLHEAATLVETGRYYDVGGGVSWLFTAGGHFHTTGAGVRLDARAVVRSQGVAFDGGSNTSPAAGASLFVRF